MFRLKNEDGQAIVEFTLILPIFVGLIFVAIGYGITLNNYLRVTDIARVAARAASVARFDNVDDPCKAALAAAKEAAGGLTLVPADALVSPDLVTCSYPKGMNPGDPITVSVRVQSQNIINNIPFLSVTLPDTLPSNATVLLQ